MEFSGIKKAMNDYSIELESGISKIKTNYAGIANVLNDMVALEAKWSDDLGDIEASVNAISDESVKASYSGQLTMLRAQRLGVIEMLSALDATVTDAGLMLI